MTGVLAAAHVYQFRGNRRQYLWLWAAGWCALGLTHFLVGLEASLGFVPGESRGVPMALALATDWFGFLAIAALFAGVWAFISGVAWTGRGLALLGVIALGLSVVTAAVAPGLEANHWRYPLRTGIAGVAALVSAWWLGWGTRRREGPRPTLVAVAIGCYSLPLFGYAVVIGRSTPGDPSPLILIGFLDSVLMVAMALSLFLWLLEHERAATAQAIAAEQAIGHEMAARDSVFRAVIDQVPDALALLDRTGRYLVDLRPDRSFLGYRADELLGQPVFDLVHPDDRPQAQAAWAGVAERPGATGVAEVRLQHRDGRHLIVECRAVNCEQVPSLRGILVLARDVTERRALERRLAQAERLESVGRLAGGVAHDFNNLLTVVRGNASLLTAELPPDSELRTFVDEIQLAADRGAGLTRHLLAFSRREPVEPRVFDVNALISDLLPLIRRLLGERVSVSWRPAVAACRVKADPNRIEQAILNLVANARDAMPEGGRLTLTTVDGSGWVELRVHDSGIGMTEEVRLRAFEPFFSTKKAGTGLGLATCYGIIEQAGGHVSLASEEGQGTTVTVLLPSVSDAVAASPPNRSESGRVAAGGPARILVAEDEPSVQRIVTRALQSSGYEVVQASNGDEAAVLASEQAFDCLVTDVVMPGLSGDALARKVWADRPAMPVLFMSGYTDEFQPNLLPRERVAGFVAKPFAIADLVAAVREVLERATVEATGGNRPAPPGGAGSADLPAPPATARSSP